MFLLLSASIVSANLFAQRSDTIARWDYHDTTTWQYKMETSDEKWAREANHGTYQLFTRMDWKTAKKKNSSAANISFYGNGTLFWLNDIDEVEVAAAGITQQNAAEFIYHVVENDSVEIVPWTRPHEFHTNNKITYAYLGKFNTSKKIVRLEIYNLKHYYDRSVLTFNDLFLPRAELKYLTLNYNNKYLFRPHQQHFIPNDKALYFSEVQWLQEESGANRKNSSNGAAATYKPVIKKLKKGDVAFNWSDSINHFAIQIKRTIQNDIYNVYLKRTVNGKADTVYISNDWALSYSSPDPILRVNSSYFNKPGEYEIIIVPEVPDEFRKNTMHQALTIPFTVLPAKTKAFTSIQVALFIAAFLLIFGIIFIFYYLINKRRLAREALKKEIAQLQLQSVRSQLNPHFMFNALAGIQNLMNKNDMNAANLYLNKFARLTRNILDDSRKDMVGITEEQSLLETYLQRNKCVLDLSMIFMWTKKLIRPTLKFRLCCYSLLWRTL